MMATLQTGHERVMQDNNAEIQGLKKQAQALLARNELKSARPLYDRICALDQADAEAWFMLGAINGSLGLFQETIACCHRTLALQPNHVSAHYNLGQAYMHLNDVAKAAESFRAAVQIKPDYADAWNNFGNALHDLRRYDEARAAYQEALRLRPDLAGTRYRLAALGGAPMPEKPPPEYVERLFDSYADKFEHQLVENLEYRTPGLLNNLIRDHITAAPASLAVLDLGCGTGLCGPLLRDVASSLTGIDISVRMLEKAREKRVYDKLVAGDITASVLDPKSVFDLIVAADVFPYVGDLSPIFRACRSVLKANGYLAFSVEALEEGQSYTLRPTDRYAHTPAYIRRLTADADLMELAMDKVVLRKDRGKPVDGYLFILRSMKSGADR